MINAETNNINCIIIDDEQEACDRFESLLSKIPGVEVTAKENNPEKGIKEVIKLFPDIVFLDVEMPGKSGFDVVSEIREMKVFPTFIFVTGYNQYAIKAIRNAAFDFLLKPVDIDELKEAINRFNNLQGEKQKNLLPEKLKSEYSDIISFNVETGQIKISAGWLIEKCGWKGKRVGDVGTSPDHALVICNFGNATGAEVLEFAMRIKEEVANKFGIKLEEEVNIL